MMPEIAYTIFPGMPLATFIINTKVSSMFYMAESRYQELGHLLYTKCAACASSHPLLKFPRV